MPFSRGRSVASLSEQAYLALRRGILTGDLPMGSALSRRKLAEELGMSIVPVAEALQRLEAEELVESRPRVGTRVKVPSPQDVRGHYVVREALETQSARLFAEKAAASERDEIRAMAAWLDDNYAAAATGTLRRERIFDLHQRHMRFHMRVAECAGYEALCRAMERNQILTYNWLYDTTADWHRLPKRFHGALADALCGGDPVAAAAVMRAHVTFGMEQLVGELDRVLRDWSLPAAVNPGPSAKRRGPRRPAAAASRARR
ncbi:MAG: GntR family transcriptional regulator [Acidobacteria bacterium]|nr:GntR family transcriptional regulator [Acidobacteriota bacterium]